MTSHIKKIVFTAMNLGFFIRQKLRVKIKMKVKQTPTKKKNTFVLFYSELDMKRLFKEPLQMEKPWCIHHSARQIDRYSLQAAANGFESFYTVNFTSTLPSITVPPAKIRLNNSLTHSLMHGSQQNSYTCSSPQKNGIDI